MAKDSIIGHITLRIPVHAHTDQESWEIPEEYTFLEPGGAELVEHDLPAGWHAHMREMLIESGTSCAVWSDEHVAAACTREEPAHSRLSGSHSIGLTLVSMKAISSESSPYLA